MRTLVDDNSANCDHVDDCRSREEAPEQGREVKGVKKTIVHNDPLDKDKQSRSSYPSEVVILEK